MSRTLRLTLALTAVALIATAAAFAATNRTHASDTFVFGTEGDPVLVDGALVSDGPSLRAVNQMFEGLVGLKPGTTKVIPSLATSWTTSKNGLAWTFKLRQGVKFHDGTKFDARSVCFNFNRNYHLPSYLQGESTNYYWVTVFGGYGKGRGGFDDTPVGPLVDEDQPSIWEAPTHQRLDTRDHNVVPRGDARVLALQH